MNFQLCLFLLCTVVGLKIRITRLLENRERKNRNCKIQKYQENLELCEWLRNFEETEFLQIFS